MLRLAQGSLALWLVPVAAVAGASAVAGCGLFVDFEDGAAAAATQGAGAAMSGSGATAGGVGGGGSGSGAGGGASEPCKVGGWQLEVLAQWPDEVVVDLVLLDGGGIAVANLAPNSLTNGNPKARDTLVRVVYPPMLAAEPFQVSTDTGVGAVRNSVALARGGKGLVVAATASEGTVRTPATPSELHPGLVAFSLDPASWGNASVHVECTSVSIEAVGVAAGAEDRIALAANSFPPGLPRDGTYECFECGGETVPPDKQLLLWPDAVKTGCPVQTGGPAAHDASPSLALLEKDLLVSASYTADTTIFGADVALGSPPDITEIDRFVARVTEGAGGPEVVWATPAARLWHGGTGGTFLVAPLDGGGILFGGGLFGWLDPTFTPFTASELRLPALARLTAVGGVVPFPSLTVEPGLLRSLQVLPGCALVAGVLTNTQQRWLTNGGVGPTFVALVDTGSLEPLGGVALPTGLTALDPPNVFAARGDKAIVVAGVYRDTPTLGGTTLQQAEPLGTFVVRVVPP